jgi:hypothetical protein
MAIDICTEASINSSMEVCIVKRAGGGLPHLQLGHTECAFY